MKSYIEEGLDSNTVSQIQKKYRCAWCWNPILVKHDRDGDYLDCGTDGCRSSGLVSEWFVRNQIRRNQLVAVEAREVLQDWIKEDRPKRSRTEIMSQMGF